jgi:hypothetical protein
MPKYGGKCTGVALPIHIHSLYIYVGDRNRVGNVRLTLENGRWKNYLEQIGRDIGLYKVGIWGK